MKVYVVSEVYPYEGGEVLVVYASREEAEAYAKELTDETRSPYYEVQEWEVT
jgi:hypothetical protein